MSEPDLTLFGPGESIHTENGENKVRYSVSLVRQGEHQFYTFTMHISILAETCFVSRRIDDPKQGFQRRLDKFRARQIATYIDVDHGVIPNAIILSAQPEANFRVIGRSKTVEFNRTSKAFLILDGQHRVYGFTMAKTALRVPVVVFNNLSLEQEARLFIDINTKQKPVPNELLLDIKKIAGYEGQVEQRLGEIYDLFNTKNDSPLLGKLAPFEKTPGKISRVTFNAGMRPLVPTFKAAPAEKIYTAIGSYLAAFMLGASSVNAPDAVTNPQVFRAVMRLFPEVAQRVADRFEKNYTADAFADVLNPLFAKAKPILRNPARNATEIYESLSKHLKGTFEI